MSLLAANGIYAAALLAGTMPLWPTRPPAVVLTLANGVPLAGCLFLGIAASSLLGKLFCVVWAAAIGGAVRQSRSRMALAAAIGINFVALLWALKTG